MLSQEQVDKMLDRKENIVQRRLAGRVSHMTQMVLCSMNISCKYT